jgi:hypothetical protein
MFKAIFIGSSGEPDAKLLEGRVSDALQLRLKQRSDLNEEEIRNVSELKARLLPEGYELDLPTTERLRLLCRLSQAELRPAASITSHRKLVGPLIVRAKRLLWPLLRAPFKDSFAALDEFNSQVVEFLGHVLAEGKGKIQGGNK